ncbi:MAG TPA: YciI family protein [Conexibacter sp.]|jgi:hypothetical protein
MRFMMMIYPGIEESEWQPDAETVAAMGKYNEELTRAGALLALDGLHAASKGARIVYRDGQRTILDGPFAESKEVIGGYWIIQAKSLEEAMEWAKRVPSDGNMMLEVRQIFEMSDFPAEVQEAAQLSQTPPNQTSA